MPPTPSRWWFTGTSGSGKTTYARWVASELEVPHLELDSVYHQPQWTPLELVEFRRRVAEFVSADRWTLDGNYSKVADLVAARADVIVALDLSRPRVMFQVVRRSLTRIVRREVLWNGNRESWRQLLSRDPETNIILWSWSTHHRRRRQFDQLESRAVPDQLVLRVRSHREARQRIAELLPKGGTSVG